MSDWTAGYVADIGYTYGYYTELNPLRVKLPFLDAGIAFPEIGTACELGFGQGMSANIHAAASAVQWWGTDFNPAQAGFAQELAVASGAGARLFDQSFAEFCHRADLPDFDYIGLHGIWSWISDQNRAVIVDFVRRKLKVGGVLYMSYNTYPGWAPMLPLQHLLARHTDSMGAAGAGTLNRLDAALDFAKRFLATHPLYAQANPSISSRLQKLTEQNRNYLAHEYFNRNWDPMHFAEFAKWIDPAKVTYACSAHLLDHVDAVNLSAEQQQFLQTLPDPMFRQTVRDFMVNQQFRRDYWVKGARLLNLLDKTEQIRTHRVILVAPRNGVELKATGSIGEATLNEGVYLPILDLLADHKPRTLNQIEQAVKDKGLVFAQVLQAIMVLVGKGDLAAVQDDKAITKARPYTDKLNAYLMNKARGSNDLAYLASPVTGGGIAVNRFQQLFLLAKTQGKKTPEEYAQLVWHLLAAQNQRLTKEGKAIESVEENLAELTGQAQEFVEKRLPVLKALGVTG